MLKSNRGLFFLFPLSFLIWLLCFRQFFTGELAFFSDAKSYYNHIQFFIKNLAHGVFPLWDTTWNCGLPNEFFLRRFGAFNPAFLLILIPYKMGFPFLFSYLFFLAIYYFIGMLGFYGLAQRVLGDQRAAFAAYLLLMFSSLGTRLFDSYILLIIVPLVWFFYCLVAFFQDSSQFCGFPERAQTNVLLGHCARPGNPQNWEAPFFQEESQGRQRHYFLGITFTSMILFSTYIPFYFLMIFFTFLICYAALYFKQLRLIGRNVIQFAKNNKVLVGLCVMAMILSALPGVLFMQESTRGELAVPFRHSASSEGNQIGVGLQTITSWGMLEDIVFSAAFHKDVRLFNFAVLYIPLFAYVVLFFGIFTSMTKKLFFFFMWGIGVFIMFSPYTSVYHFLYK